MYLPAFSDTVFLKLFYGRRHLYQTKILLRIFKKQEFKKETGVGSSVAECLASRRKALSAVSSTALKISKV